jgi:uncharacterized protein (TIGR02246 family)
MEKAMQQLMAATRAVVIGTAAICCVAAVAAEPVAKPADETEIRRIISEMTDGFNRHDGRAASRMYLPNATLVTVRGEMMEGRAAIESGLASIFKTRARNATLRTLHVTIRFLRPDVALANVTNELSGLVAPEGEPLPSHQELSLRVFTKEDGSWKLAAFHNTIIHPFAVSPR